MGIEPMTAQLAEAIAEGVTKSNTQYNRWSNGYWISDAGIENVMQTYVAEACFDACGASGLHVHVEANLKYFFEREDETRRVDILVTDANEVPLYAIELKRGGSWYGADASKIYDFLIGYRHRSDRRIKACFWGAFVTWNEKMRKCRSLDLEVERTRQSFLDAMGDRRLSIEWSRRDIPHLMWDNGDEMVRWEAAVLVATITRR